MSKMPFGPLSTRIANLRYFLPAAALFVLAAVLPHYAAAALLVVADAFAMAAWCRFAGLAAEGDFGRTLLRRASAYFVLLAAYAALLVLLTAYPLQWLLRERSLGATLAVSTEVVVALLCLWRHWPAFGLVFIWPPASESADDESLLRRVLRFAREISGANELFFSHGLVVASSVLLLAAGALALATAGLEPLAYAAGVAIYALVLVPAASAAIANRCARALLIELHRVRAERRAAESREVDAATAAPAAMPAPDGADDIDARLLRCARSGQTELALGALAHGADPNAVPPSGERDQRSVLVLATLGADLRLLRQLIAKGADLNRVHAGLTPLLAATRDSHQGRPEAVTTLLTNGADPRCVDPAGNTPLHYAALSATPIVCALLCDASAPIDAVNRDGLTPLAMACAAGNWPLVRFLLDRGAKAEPARAQPALLGAAGVTDDDPSGVELLIRRKADVNARDALGRSALMIAALQGNAVIAETLLDAGADIDAADTRGTTALMEAARAGAEDVVELLLARRPALDACDAIGRTALLIACQSRAATDACVRRLLDAGASRDLAGSDGKRAVDFAAAAGRWSLVAMLDPQYPLPASVADVEAGRSLDPESPQHLLDALRFAHWTIAETFAARVRAWAPDEVLRLHRALVDHEPAAPRLWLIDHGLQAIAATASGDAHWDALAEDLPASAAALREWLDAGAQPTGAARLLRLCRALSAATSAQRPSLEMLGAAIIERGGDVFGIDADGRTPLAHAVAAGAPELVRALLARGVDPNLRDRLGRTPLHEALALHSEPARQILPLLLAAGASPEVAAVNGETPLGLALARPESELRAWLNWPAWKLPPRALRDADLPAAAAAGDRDAVDKLLALGLPLHAVDAQGADALQRAAGCGHASLVAHLLERGADPLRTAPSGATALSAAVSARRDDVVALLMERGVPADQRLPTGATPLMIACALGFPEIAARLLAAGAQANAQDERGTRALHAAAQFAFRSSDTDMSRRLLEALLRHGAEIDAVNGAGQTPLLLLLGGRAEAGSVADQKHLLALLPLFLLARADVNRQDQRGVAPLHACAMHGLLLPARALLAANADPLRRDVLDRTARQVAHLLGFVDVAAELGAREAAAQVASGD